MEERDLDIAIDDARWTDALSDPEALIAATFAAVFAHEGRSGPVSVALADDAAVRDLNGRFRGKDKPTNVLSFPPPPAFPDFLGDIVLAYETVEAEAVAHGKSFTDHARHLLAHGLLHLLGYDHETEADASVMEGKERAILAGLGAPDPYADHG
jgi:probable rRNA maturation factor